MTTPPRGTGKFRILRPRSRRHKPSPVGIRYVEPDPRTPPEEAATLRNALSGLSGWDLERLDR